jgi:uncharacterized membrane protein YfcA
MMIPGAVPLIVSQNSLWLFAASLGASALGGMLGMAGGIFIVPILTMWGHIEIHQAIGASIVSVIACSCGSSAHFLKAGLTNIRLAIVLETATTIGALTGVFLAGIAPVSILYFLFAVVLLVSASQMFARRSDPEATTFARERMPLAWGLMYGAGLISALLGIGSGVLKIPAMDTALRLPLRVSSATSNFMIGVTASASAGAYLLRGDIVPAIAGPVALGAVAGAFLGARILLAVSHNRIRLLFVIVLVALAVQMLVNTFGVSK